MDRPLAALADHLLERQETLIAHWLKRCYEDPRVTAVNGLAFREFQNNIPQTLRELAEKLRREPAGHIDEAERETIARHGQSRWKQGFNLTELVRDWGCFNEVLLETVEDYFEAAKPDHGARRRATHLLSRFIGEAMAASVERYDALRKAEAASVLRDLEGTKQRMEQLDRARVQLLREAAHDIKGGLSAITGASSVIRASEENHGNVGEMAAVIEGSVTSVTEMLDALLDLARIEAGEEVPEIEEVDVGELLSALGEGYESAAGQKGLKLDTEGPAKLRVQTDAVKLRRITGNLLNNAVRYTEAGSIVLAWGGREEGWWLEVRDTGPGAGDIPGIPGTRADGPIHDGPAERTPGGESPGEGIGLTIVKRLCELLDASIEMDSKRGEGTAFTLKFPARYPE